MGLFDRFPWTNEHQLNLDWILRILKQLQGGTMDQVLTRKSNKPFDFGWKTMSGGGGGTTDYDELGNKPQVNGVTLQGNKSLLDLGIINRFPGLNLPKMNSSNPSAGGSTRYSPEDHVHPSDTSRTTSKQVGSMITSALAWYDPASKSFNPPYDAGTIGKAIEDALAGGVSPEAIQAAVDAYLDDHPALTGMFTNAAKNALIELLENVAYINGNGQQYLDELITNLAATVTSISAVFTQGTAIISNNDSLDSLRQYLVVTANFSDGTSTEVTTYTLSGTLEAGTSTITASYAGKTTTFTVTVTGMDYIASHPWTFYGTSATQIWNNTTQVGTVVANGTNGYPGLVLQGLLFKYSDITGKSIRVKAHIEIGGGTENGYGVIVALGLYTSTTPTNNGSDRATSYTVYRNTEHGSYDLDTVIDVSDMSSFVGYNNDYLGLGLIFNSANNRTATISDIVLEVTQ